MKCKPLADSYLERIVNVKVMRADEDTCKLSTSSIKISDADLPRVEELRLESSYLGGEEMFVVDATKLSANLVQDLVSQFKVLEVDKYHLNSNRFLIVGGERSRSHFDSLWNAYLGAQMYLESEGGDNIDRDVDRVLLINDFNKLFTAYAIHELNENLPLKLVISDALKLTVSTRMKYSPYIAYQVVTKDEMTALVKANERVESE